MPPAVFRLVLLVSCAHALVHVFELSLPSVEQLIGAEFQVGRETTGMLGLAWRLPFGLGALLAGWLADRYGSKRLLMTYLFGCAAAAALTWFSTTLALVFAVMFLMGCFASIYHPAGLSLISRVTSIENRGSALGWHGIIGSIGIAGAPFLAAVTFSIDGASWRMYYLVLAAAAVALGLALAVRLKEEPRRRPRPDAPDAAPGAEEEGRWPAFFLLVAVGSMMGLVYAGFVHFLTRFLDGAGLRPDGVNDAAFRNYLTALVMLFAVVGQWLAGRLARHDRLESLLSIVLFANAPLLLWMAFADGVDRLLSTCAMALVHFMHQPIYNSLVAKYVPDSRRSLGYGFSNMIGFGMGALGPAFAGFVPTFRALYASLAGVVMVAALLALALKRSQEAAVLQKSSLIGKP